VVCALENPFGSRFVLVGAGEGDTSYQADGLEDDAAVGGRSQCGNSLVLPGGPVGLETCLRVPVLRQRVDALAALTLAGDQTLLFEQLQRRVDGARTGAPHAGRLRSQ